MKIFQTLHSYWGALFFILFTYLIYRFIRAFLSKREYNSWDLHIVLYTLIFGGIQLFLGLSWYFSSTPYHFLKTHGLAETLSHSDYRLTALFHPAGMIVAYILMILGYRAHNKAEQNEIHKHILYYYIPAFILIISLLPWKIWLNK
jgi:hypothetical protein